MRKQAVDRAMMIVVAGKGNQQCSWFLARPGILEIDPRSTQVPSLFAGSLGQVVGIEKKLGTEEAAERFGNRRTEEGLEMIGILRSLENQ